jgi:hypothetical protein
MKIQLLVLTTMTTLGLFGCIKAPDSNYTPSTADKLQAIAAQVKNDTDQCPFISGRFCKEDDSTNCRYIDMQRTSPNDVLFSDGKVAYLPVDGAIHSGVEKDGTPASMMAYCSHLRITVVFSTASDLYEEHLSLNQTGSKLHAVGSGTLDGAPRDVDSTYKRNR